MRLVKSESDFPADFENSLDWMRSNEYIGPNYYLTKNDDMAVSTALDNDFIGFVFEAIDFIKIAFKLVYCPNFAPDSRLGDCKMSYAGVSLHNVPNIALG